MDSYGKIDLFISPSQFLKDKFKEFDFKGEIRYIPNPLLGSFCQFEAKDDANGPLVYYGRLSKEKGIDVAIRAIQNLPGEKIQIIGDGPEKDNLMKLVRELKLTPRVEFLGFKSGEALKEILNKAKAIIIPSVWYENMPYTIAEALCLRKIVIASNIGGIPDLIIDGQNGFLFEAGNAKVLAEKIKMLNEIDVKKIKTEAARSVERFSAENYYTQVMTLYEKIREKHQKHL